MKLAESQFDWLERRIARASPIEKIGKVVEVRGLIIESEGPEACVGDVCYLESSRLTSRLAAEVVGFRENRLLLMPYEQTHAVHPGCRVTTTAGQSRVPAGAGLIGRVIDGLGRPLDGKGPLTTDRTTLLHRDPPNPLARQRIRQPFPTGIRALDTFTPVGEGQRMGIFAGSGVGKSTLLGMIARGAASEVNVVALIGERGRELREFLENDLGDAGLARSIVVVSTSDQAAPLRLRAALLATALAEYFRDEGQRVMLLLDSLTRLAMAQREIGLAVGEPPTSRGYPPSVFGFLPRVLERTGMGENGSITALYTVLVEGDDFNEPIADTVRGILDGHILLSRSLATANHFPAVDVLESVSRLTQAICDETQLEILGKARDTLSLYRKNEDLITIGAYAKGSNPRLDTAIQRTEQLKAFLRQKPHEVAPVPETWQQLQQLMT